MGGARRGADPDGDGDEEGDWDAARRRPEEIVGPAPAAELERAAMAAEMTDIQKSGLTKRVHRVGGGGGTGTETNTNTYGVAGGVDCSPLACYQESITDSFYRLVAD